MKVLVVGSGGREHALCWSFKHSPLCTKLYCAPGNAGIARIATCLAIDPNDSDMLVATCADLGIDFVMVGPEGPLANGLIDKLRAANILCFGPTQKAAALESSKGFMKDLCALANVPTAAYQRFTDPLAAKDYVCLKGAPIVVKADGLAAGKGVTVARTIQEAFKAIDAAMIDGAFGASGQEIVIEECLIGEEASFFALCDGETAIPFTAAQDHKAAYDGDQGPNTGGMGAYSPAPIVDPAMTDRIMREIIQPTLTAMKTIGAPFTGVLFAGLMITANGPKLIEYNVRFGDPETQAMLPRLKSDLLDALLHVSKGEANKVHLIWDDKAALCVVMAAKGYPDKYEKGTEIGNLREVNLILDTAVFHAGTIKDDKGRILANGGRVLGVTGRGPTLQDAYNKAYEVVSQIEWPDGFYRHDIGWRALKRV
jgi:phosphoribosylamine--glycine ligase